MVPYKEDDLVWNKLNGTVRSADYMTVEEAETVVKSSQLAKSLSLSWVHDASGRLHEFTIDSIQRKEDVGEVFIEWSGDAIDVDVEGELNYEIPSLNDFKMMEVDVIQSPEQIITLHFSDPLKKNQDLEGLITLEGSSKLRFEIEGNAVKVYPGTRQKGNKILSLETEVKNILGYGLKQTEKIEVAFIEVKPALKLRGGGVILPSTNGLVFPFEAVNLSAVDVTVTKVFENNVHQFLQVNRLNGTNQLTRVGKIVMKKKINLTSEKAIDYGVWNSFTLDLEELIETEPGAIYRIHLDFKRSYSMFPCDEEYVETGEEEDDDWNSYESDVANWEYYDDYYYDDYYYDDYYYDYDYDYRQRDNPCHSSYYRQSRAVARNILASNIGLIAKGGTDKRLFVAVSDIRTTEPLSGVTVELYDYQNQKIGEAKNPIVKEW